MPPPHSLMPKCHSPGTWEVGSPMVHGSSEKEGNRGQEKVQTTGVPLAASLSGAGASRAPPSSKHSCCKRRGCWGSPSATLMPWWCLVHLVRSQGEQWSPAWDPPSTQTLQQALSEPRIEAFAEGPGFLTPCLRPTSSLETGGRRDPHSGDKGPCVQRLPGRQPAPSTAPGT